MKKLILAAMAAGAMIVMTGASADAQQRPRGFYDEQGQFRGQLWCLRRDSFTRDCSYYTYEQCMASSFTLQSFCEQNQWSFQAQPYAAPVPKKRKVRRSDR